MEGPETMPDPSHRLQLTYRPRNGPRHRLTFEPDPSLDKQAYHYWLAEAVYEADVDDGRWRETGREHVDPPELDFHGKQGGMAAGMGLESESGSGSGSGGESPPDTRATERAKTIAWEYVATAYHEGAAEAAEDALLEDPLWQWLAVAATRAADLETYRALDAVADEQGHDSVYGHLDHAAAHLSSARDQRRDELLTAALDKYDPEVIAP